MKYKMIDQHRHEYSISRLCDVFEVSRSGYYNWVGRGPSHREQEDDRIGQRIEVIFSDHYRCYGVPRMQSALQDEGFGISRKRIARLMKQRDCCVKKKKDWKPQPAILIQPDMSWLPLIMKQENYQQRHKN